MHSAVVSLLLSLVATLLLLQCGGRLFKVRATPADLARGLQPTSLPVGGIAILVGLCAGGLTLLAKAPIATQFCWVALSALLPLFVAGAADDFWLLPSLLRRACITAAVCAVALMFFDALPDHGLFRVGAVTVFVVAVTHSLTAVDSRNGAAAMCSLLIHAAVAYVAYSVGDTTIMLAALIVIGALLGVSFFSFQTDLARLGQSGCSLAGFSTAALAVCLTLRHAEVSVLFAVVLCSHSLIEAASAWKRNGLAGLDSVDNRVPSLLFHRLVRWATGNPPDRRRPERDTSVMPHLWMLSVASITPALLWWKHTAALLAALMLRVALHWAVSSLLQPPHGVVPATETTPETTPEMPPDPAFFLKSARVASRAESGTQ